MNIEKLLELLPRGYEDACYETKAIERRRNIKSPMDLMKICLIYLSQKCSLLEMSETVYLMGMGKLSDVAFMKRFAHCGEWFRWILERIAPQKIIEYKKPKSMEKYTFVAFDASDITEKGATKRIWRLHYAIDIFTMSSLEYKITDEKTGESLTNFTLKPEYLILGDRAYASKTGIEYCVEQGADFILRIKNKAFKLYNEDRKELILLEKLNEANEEKAIDIDIFMENSRKELVPLRICALKKTAEEIAKAQKRIHRSNSKKQMELSEETAKTHEYIFVITNLPKDICADDVLETYRLRWQIELAFKRLKSIMNLGDLPKRKNDGVIAWLHGKLMVALLLEKLLGEMDFSPSDQT